jgi:Flp pilus assembly protein TadD
MRMRHPLLPFRRTPVLIGAACTVLWLCGCAGPQRAAVSAASNSDESRSDFDKRRDLPPSAKTLYAMADILARQGKDTECEFVLRRCINEHPEFTPAYNRLAELQMRQGRLNEAADTLTNALHIRPQDPVLMNNQGMCLLIGKQYEKALEQFTRAAGIVPESGKYRANMATTLGLLGRQEESLALLQQVLPHEKAQHNAEVLRRAYEKQAGSSGSVQG